MLTDVRHVPDLKKNLISVGVLDSSGRKFVTHDVTESAVVADTGSGGDPCECTRLWHRRLQICRRKSIDDTKFVIRRNVTFDEDIMVTSLKAKVTGGNDIETFKSQEVEIESESHPGRCWGEVEILPHDENYSGLIPVYEKLHEPLEGKKPDSMDEKAWNLLDRQALGVVRLTLARNVAYNIVKEMTTYGLIKSLSNMYEKPSASNKVYLIHLLVATRLNEGDCVADHVNEFNSILAKLASVDIKFDDEVQALWLASSLPDSWSGFLTTIRETRERSRSKSQKRGQSKDHKDIVCWNFQKKGHFKDHCTAPASPKGKGKEDNSASVVEEVVDDDVLICCVECSVESWVMNSGESFHATHCKDLMLNFRVENFGKVRLTDDETLDIAGMGDINLRTLWELAGR
ncbi:hypothetical protein AgCh_005839 [Apium graveolens]